MRKWVIGIVVLVVAAAGAFLAFGPAYVERSMNRVVPVPLRITPVARGFAVADMHADTLMWLRDPLTRGDRGQVDLPRLRDGGYALQIFSSVTKTPRGQNYDANGGDTDNITALVIAQRQPPRTWTSLLQRSLYHAHKLGAAIAASGDGLRAIWSPTDLDRLLADRAKGSGGAAPVGAMLSIEGLQSMEGDLANLDRLHAAGFRMASLTHFFDNDLAGSMHGLKKGGLTPLGRQAVRRMESLGMIVDVAHASHATVADILAMAQRPVVSSHGGVQATCKVNRNLTDDEIRGVARTGGVVGIGDWDAAVCGTTPAKVADAIAHVRDVAGIDHVGLGSDFDGAVTTGFDAGGVPAIAQALLDRGFGRADVAKVMGGNVLRVVRAGIVPRPAAR